MAIVNRYQGRQRRAQAPVPGPDGSILLPIVWPTEDQFGPWQDLPLLAVHVPGRTTTQLHAPEYAGTPGRPRLKR